MAAESTVYDHCMIEDILLNEKIASHLTKPIRCRISKVGALCPLSCTAHFNCHVLLNHVRQLEGGGQ